MEDLLLSLGLIFLMYALVYIMFCLTHGMK